MKISALITQEVAAGKFILSEKEIGSTDKKMRRDNLASLEPIFLLSLYSDRFFDITDLLHCEPGWKVDRVRTGMNVNELTPERYVVTKDQWNNFEKFIQLCEQARKSSREWRPISIARRHYLTATFAPEDPFRMWATKGAGGFEAFPEILNDYDNDESDGSIYGARDSIIVFENVLLRYISVIESLVAGRLDRTQNHIVFRCELLVGRDEAERQCIHDHMKEAYLLRNQLAHGDEPHPPLLNTFDLRKLRRICQRAIAITLALLASHPEKETGEFLRWLHISPIAPRAVAKARAVIYELIQDPAPLDGTLRISRTSRRR